MAIAVTRQSGRRDQEGGRGARDDAEGAARRHPRRRLHGLLLPVRVVATASRAPRTRCWRSKTAPVRVFVDPKSFIYLDGSTLEYQTTMMGRGFKFMNPNVKGTCGCGESVQF